MYLSKIVLSWPACRNPYQWHRTIWQLFPNHQEAERSFLFSCIDHRPGKNISALLFSIEKPERIQSKEVTLSEEPKSLAGLSFKPGQMLGFRLTANPTKVITEQTDEIHMSPTGAGMNQRKIRVPLIKREQQEDWLKRKLDGLAVVENVMPQNEPPLYFNRKNRGGKIVPVTFEGILRVVNPEKFKEQIYEKYNEKGEYIAGIGPAKAFGCGLMMVKRI